MSSNHTESKKKMTYVRLGQSGLKVSRIILGLMSYGSPEWSGWVQGEEEGIKHIKAAYDAGIQTFDTANVYSNGESEKILGKAIKQLKLPRDEIVVMTKHIFESVKHSLERLQLDYVDVLQCHRFDNDTPISETMQALHDVVKAGYVRYIGMSSCHAYQFHAMQNYAINNSLTPFISMQNHHNLLYREEEREMMFGVGMIPWSPLARGALTRPLGSQATTRSETDPWASYLPTTREANAAIVNRVEEIAKARNISMAQVAVAWSLSKDYMTAPIIGTTSLKNLEDIIGGIDVKLTEEEIKQLEDPYVPQPISPKVVGPTLSSETKLVYLPGVPILSGEEVLKRTLEEYGSIDDEVTLASSPECVKAAVRQDINVLFRGPISTGMPLSLNKVMQVNSSPSVIPSNLTPSNAPARNTAPIKLLSAPRQIPVWISGGNERNPPRPSPVLTGTVIYTTHNRPRWSPVSHTTFPCLPPSPLRQSTLPPGWATAASP
ncbi:hypothetical protein FRC09_012771 [Ceratobasidium sp. 395]|nr:hypothetical protein FRC09_012771 [Ceratobasidium sp. 395]